VVQLDCHVLRECSNNDASAPLSQWRNLNHGQHLWFWLIKSGECPVSVNSDQDLQDYWMQRDMGEKKRRQT
jgi:hypothetical protein